MQNYRSDIIRQLNELIASVKCARPAPVATSKKATKWISLGVDLLDNMALTCVCVCVCVCVCSEGVALVLEKEWSRDPCQHHSGRIDKRARGRAPVRTKKYTLME